MRKAIDTWLKINDSVYAKDRLYRLVQYGSKLICSQVDAFSFLLTPKQQLQLSMRLRALSNAIALCRKFYRIGRWIEQLRCAKRGLCTENELERSLVFTKAIGLAIWLFLDTIQWLNRSRVFDLSPGTMFVIDRTASSAWLLSIVSSVMLNGYGLSNALEVDAKSRQSTKFATNLIISICDLFLPLAQLGYVQNETFIGACGVLSSYLGLKQFLKSK